MQRPTSVTVFGILNIVFAVFGLLGLMASVAMLSASADPSNPVIRIMRENPTYMMWLKLMVPLGLIACGVLLAAGIGLLLLKGWARKAAIGYGVYTIVSGLVGTAVNFVFLVRPMLEEAAHKSGPEAAGAMGGAIGSVFGGFIGLIYPVLLLIFMTRPKVVAAFRSGPSGIPPQA